MAGMCMSQVLVPEAFLHLPADAEKPAIITLLAEKLVACGEVDANALPAIVEGALAREAVGSTGIGHGIAIPHCRAAQVDHIVCAYGSCRQGLDFDSLDGESVHSVFLLLTPPDQREQHLQLMKSFASLIRKEHFSEFLRQADDPVSLANLLAEFEAE